MPSKSQLDRALSRYPAALALRAAATKSSTDLIALDQWYRGELRAAVHTRIKRDDEPEQRFTLDELKRVMDWKLAVRLLSLSDSSSHCSSHSTSACEG